MPRPIPLGPDPDLGSESTSDGDAGVPRASYMHMGSIMIQRRIETHILYMDITIARESRGPATCIWVVS